MLAIRMQRLGRKGHPTYRVVVQDVRQTPTSGKYVALLGNYDPHTKTSTLAKDRAEFYLSNGAQPSDRVVGLFQAQGIKLPKWVKTENSVKTRSIRNPEKLRKNRPDEPVEEAAPEAETAPIEEAAAEEKPAEEPKEAPEAPEAEKTSEETKK